MSLVVPQAAAQRRRKFCFSPLVFSTAILAASALPAWGAEYSFVGGGWDNPSSWLVDGATPAEAPDGDDTLISPSATAGNLSTGGDDHTVGAVDLAGSTSFTILGTGSDTITIRQTMHFGGGSFTIRGSTVRPALVVQNEAGAATAVLVDVATTLGTSTSTSRPLTNFTINNGLMELNANVTLAAETAALNGGVHLSEGTATTFTFNTMDFQTNVAFLSGGIATSKVINSTSVPAGTPVGTIARLVIDGNDTFTPKTYAGLILDGSTSRFTSVQKTGSITQALSGANTYTGGTTISGGTLLANSTTGTATASSTGAGAVLVQNGGTLGGTGNVSGTVTVEAGGAVRGGDGTAGTTLTLSNGAGLALGDDAVIKLTLGDGFAHSTLARTGGTWTFDSNQRFVFDGAATPGLYQDLITGLAADPGTSAWTIGNGAWTGSFIYDGGTVDLDLTAVPEPSIVTPLLGVVGLLLRRRRRE